MASYARNGNYLVWEKMILCHSNIPTLLEIIKAARKEFPRCSPAKLEIIACGDRIILQKKTA